MSTVSIYHEMESSPTVVLYGDGGDHEMILRDIDGWYGSPESKVQLSERAYGNGAHDIASEDIDYGARTVMVDWRIIANGRDGMLSALHAIRTLVGHTVRVRVVDGMDDLYAVGYVHEAGKDKSAQNIPQQTETGTLTIVCQRPELLSTRASQAQLMPVSRVRGGMSYGVPAYELAWTGTPNASASTLSQDGAVIATNAAEDPNITQTIRAFSGEGPWVRSPDVTSPSGYSWTFTAQKNTWQWLGELSLIGRKGLVSNPHPGEKMHVLLYTGSTLPDVVNIQVDIYNGTSWTGQPNHLVIAPGPMAWSEATFTMSTDPSVQVRLNSFYGIGSTGTVTIGAVMLLTDTDYQALRARGVTWFDGDSQSPQPNAGLSYGPDNKGLSYGVSAEGERNLMIVGNRGTTVSYPTITVTGPFPNGVEIQTGVGGVIRYTGAIGMVPLVIQCDPRNVAASMGGVDVGRYLTGRDLPAIPAGGSMSLRLMSAGSGWVTVTVRDTYL